ncbi:MAG TPA: hypothetical protein VLW52_03100, partial [Opitutaceae bacterium]|nr:hypothetical protein [Opitutaceae bacterium]
PGFLPSLPPDAFTAAGLQKLTPVELARLEALVQQYKSGALAVVQLQADAQTAAARHQAEVQAAASRQEAEQKIAAAESKTREAEAKAQAAAAKTPDAETLPAAAPARKQPRWFTALLTLDRANAKPGKEEPLESRLVGDFDGWHGQTVFTLENGTRWKQQNRTESYNYAPALHSPKVRITPAAFHGFWMEVAGVNLSVRVVPLDLTQSK